jgi:hypothetical protein
VLAVYFRPQVQWEFWTNSNDECGVLCDKQRKFIRVRATSGGSRVLVVSASSSGRWCGGLSRALKHA